MSGHTGKTRMDCRFRKKIFKLHLVDNVKSMEIFVSSHNCIKWKCSNSYLCIVVVGSAILLLDIFSSGCEEGQRVEILMARLLPTRDELPVVK